MLRKTVQALVVMQVVNTVTVIQYTVIIKWRIHSLIVPILTNLRSVAGLVLNALTSLQVIRLKISVLDKFIMLGTVHGRNTELF